MEFEQIIMSEESATLGLCQREAQPAQKYQLFIIFTNLKKNYVTNFFQSQFC